MGEQLELPDASGWVNPDHQLLRVQTVPEGGKNRKSCTDVCVNDRLCGGVHCIRLHVDVCVCAFALH